MLERPQHQCDVNIWTGLLFSEGGGGEGRLPRSLQDEGGGGGKSIVMEPLHLCLVSHMEEVCAEGYCFDMVRMACFMG